MATAPNKPSQEQLDDDEYEESSCFSQLFRFPCRRNSNRTERRSLLQGECKESWWKKRGKRIKELSELLAGPKWKTFIRRFNCNNNNNKRRPQFQYDPLSYALNFDGGVEDDGTGHNFSARFA